MTLNLNYKIFLRFVIVVIDMSNECHLVFIPSQYSAKRLVSEINDKVSKIRPLSDDEREEIEDSLDALINGDELAESDFEPSFIDSDDDDDFLDRARVAMNEVVGKFIVRDLETDNEERSWVNINSPDIRHRIDEIGSSC